MSDEITVGMVLAIADEIEKQVKERKLGPNPTVHLIARRAASLAITTVSTNNPSDPAATPQEATSGLAFAEKAAYNLSLEYERRMVMTATFMASLQGEILQAINAATKWREQRIMELERAEEGAKIAYQDLIDEKESLKEQLYALQKNYEASNDQVRALYAELQECKRLAQ